MILLPQKKISLSEIKLSSNAISSAIILLKDIVVRPTHNNKTIVCMSIENETNEIELRALEILTGHSDSVLEGGLQ